MISANREIGLRSIWVAIAASLMALLAMAAPAHAAFPGANGKLAVTAEPVCCNQSNIDVYSVNPDGTSMTLLTNSPGFDGQPAWSPDGTKIAFASDRDDPNSGACLGAQHCNFEIYVMNADGSGETRITTFSGADVEPAWSPDGTKIAFTSTRDDPNPTTCGYPNPECDYDIFVMDADGSNVTHLVDEPTTDGNASWSPDGSRIAYDTCMGLPCFGGAKVVAVDGSGAPVDLLGETMGEPAGCDFSASYEPNWSPNAARLVFITWESCGGDYYFDITTANSDGSGVVSVLADDFENSHHSPVFSPDGKKIADGDPSGVVVRNADGSNATHITPCCEPAMRADPPPATARSSACHEARHRDRAPRARSRTRRRA